MTGPKTAAINFGYTAPDVRKHGIATLLLNEILVWAASNKLERCSVDFESQNKEGREFWLKYFTPVCFSSIRHELLLLFAPPNCRGEQKMVKKLFKQGNSVYRGNMD